MNDCCGALQSQFDRKFARKERARFERRGPIPTTRSLVDALIEAGVEGSTVQDGRAFGGASLAQNASFAASPGAEDPRAMRRSVRAIPVVDHLKRERNGVLY